MSLRGYLATRLLVAISSLLLSFECFIAATIGILLLTAIAWSIRWFDGIGFDVRMRAISPQELRVLNCSPIKIPTLKTSIYCNFLSSFSCFTSVPPHHEIGNTIKEINDSLNRIYENREIF
ncbi:hypothetical protein IEQ34_001142 [Dendrobium chrysotoxum]|uniref:Uncharacterized protein n=1 Tax=Dendrobium chrysotoxum TaxID=161865 RepID=A0AAV7HMV3_DENCH|nr:hypothetical protein IEQ34_001142 [Dendrobium chrysotoxum]